MEHTPDQDNWLAGYREYARTIGEEALKDDLSPEAYDRLKKEFFRNIGIPARYLRQKEESKTSAVIGALLGQGVRRIMTISGLVVAAIAVALAVWVTSFSGINLRYAFQEDTLRGGPPAGTPTRVEELVGSAINVTVSFSRSSIAFRLTDGTKVSGTVVPAAQLNIPEEPLKRFFTLTANARTATGERVEVTGTAIVTARDTRTPTVKLTLADISWSQLTLVLKVGELPPKTRVCEYLPVR